MSDQRRAATVIRRRPDRGMVESVIGPSLVVMTLISPYIALPGGLPSIRLEQILLLIVAIPGAILYLRRRDHRRVTIVDIGFLTIAATTGMTLLLAPALVQGVTRNPRDVFELMRILEYWLVYRIGLTLVNIVGSVAIARALTVATIVLGAFAVIQYLGPAGFNDLVTAWWTTGHNLLGTIREGRAVGTAGNANQFGILASLLLFVAVAGRGSAPRVDIAGWTWAAIVAATTGLMLSQSRGAMLSAVVGLTFAAGVLVVRRESRRFVSLVAPAMATAIVLVLVLVSLAPPESGSMASRFNVGTILRDPSVLVRLGRLGSIVADEGPGSPLAGVDPRRCLEEQRQSTNPVRGHERSPGVSTSVSVVDARALADAVAEFYCSSGRWPESLGKDLDPVLGADPANPDRAAFALYTSPQGFVVGRRDSVDPVTGPVGAGSLRNLFVNPSFEEPGNPPAGWLVTPGSNVTTVADEPAFGSTAADATLAADGAVYQLIVADLPMNVPFTIGAWVRPAHGTSTSLQLYVVAITADGVRLDPLDQRSHTVPGDTDWRYLGLTFQTPNMHLTALQVMIRSPDGPSRVYLDGASVTQGPFAMAFDQIDDRPATSYLRGANPSFRDSPLFGVGPQKDIVLSTFDNEYAWFLVHYGLLGLAAYGLLFLTALIVGLRAALTHPGWEGLMGVALSAFTVALGLFAVSAGAYGQLQVMVIYWLIVGIVAALPSIALPSGWIGPLPAARWSGVEEPLGSAKDRNGGS